MTATRMKGGPSNGPGTKSCPAAAGASVIARIKYVPLTVCFSLFGVFPLFFPNPCCLKASTGEPTLTAPLRGGRGSRPTRRQVGHRSSQERWGIPVLHTSYLYTVPRETVTRSHTLREKLRSQKLALSLYVCSLLPFPFIGTRKLPDKQAEQENQPFSSFHTTLTSPMLKLSLSRATHCSPCRCRAGRAKSSLPLALFTSRTPAQKWVRYTNGRHIFFPQQPPRGSEDWAMFFLRYLLESGGKTTGLSRPPGVSQQLSMCVCVRGRSK